MLDARNQGGENGVPVLHVFASPSFLLRLMPLVNHKEFQSVVMEQRQTQQLLQEASASLKRFYVKEAHS